MKNITLTLLAAAAIGTVSFGSASAMPFSNLSAALGESLVQDVRMVCDQNGYCYDTNRRNRNSRRDDAPRYYNDGPRYYNEPSYGYYNEPSYGYHAGPGVAVGIGPFGFRTW
jgi:hypothetical protein